MKYVGSKDRIAKHLLPVMLAERKPDQWWVEPFVGGANMIDKVDGKRLGNDSHKYVIALLKALQCGWVPPTRISKERYHEIKKYPDGYPDELVGFVGFVCSFGGKWWGGYACCNQGRNYAAEAVRNLAKQAPNLAGVEFACGNYLDLEIPPTSLIYCDPPYTGVNYYRDDFDHEAFWQWCRARATEGHTVFVSEYCAPADFTCVKTVEHLTILNKDSYDKRTEKLFRCEVR